jgi:glycosyltransferase involved in cell wall biosynthesis
VFFYLDFFIMKLSIVTINYNNLLGLQKTVESVRNQTWRNFEHIIIDGGSTDGGEIYIKNNADNFSYWISEPDNGIYNALNKGVLASKGEYLLMLNSGDYLVNNQILSKLFDENKFNEDIVYGNVFREKNGVVFSEGIQPNILTFNYFRLSMINHQSMLIKRSLHDNIGLYDENLKLAADWKFLILAICKYNASYLHLNLSFSVYNIDGVSSKYMFTKMKDEKDLFFQNEFTAFRDDFINLDSFIANQPSERLKRGYSNLIFNSKKLIKRVVPVSWYKKHKSV